MPKKLIVLVVLSIFINSAYSQIQEATDNTKRKKVEVPNYTLFLHLHDMAVEYSSKLDFKTDSLMEAKHTTSTKHLFDFRIRALQSLQHALYKSDPVVAFLDGWVYAEQMVRYLNTTDAKNYLGYGHATIETTYKDLLQEFQQSYIILTGNESGGMSQRMSQFANNHPITNYHLNRTSIADETAQWVGEASIGFKSGVATLTDAMRNVSDRLNYHAEFTPKLVEWNVEKTINRIVGTDSIGVFIESLAALDELANAVDSLDHLVLSISDTLMTDVDRQRLETLAFAERLILKEREASLAHLEEIIQNTTESSFDRVDQIVDRVFNKVLILLGIAFLGIILAVVLYKKL
jgi:hypothetical protein